MGCFSTIPGALFLGLFGVIIVITRCDNMDDGHLETKQMLDETRRMLEEERARNVDLTSRMEAEEIRRLVEEGQVRGPLIVGIQALLYTHRLQVRWLLEFIDAVKEQQLKINIATTIATAGTVVSTGALCFPLTAPGAAAGLSAFRYARYAISELSTFLNKEKAEQLIQLVDRSRQQEQEVMVAYTRWMDFIEAISVRLNVDLSFIREVILKADLKPSFLKNLSTGQYSQEMPNLKGKELGGYFMTAILESIVSIADTIESWASDNPNVTSAKLCLEKVEDNIKQLADALEKFR